jgi:hypothetical protein
MKNTILLAALSVMTVASFGPLASSPASAGECIVHTIRTACPGKEAESYSKCGGSKSCDKEDSADSEAACVAAAKAGCPNSRLEITKSKVVKARFNGKQLKGPYGGGFCSQSRPDFNKCK